MQCFIANRIGPHKRSLYIFCTKSIASRASISCSEQHCRMPEVEVWSCLTTPGAFFSIPVFCDHWQRVEFNVLHIVYWSVYESYQVIWCITMMGTIWSTRGSYIHAAFFHEYYISSRLRGKAIEHQLFIVIVKASAAAYCWYSRIRELYVFIGVRTSTHTKVENIGSNQMFAFACVGSTPQMWFHEVMQIGMCRVEAIASNSMIFMRLWLQQSGHSTHTVWRRSGL